MKNFVPGHITELVNRSSLIVVTSHHNPDGDAIGSILALSVLFTRMGKMAIPMVPNEYPGFLKWMPGNENVIIYQANQQKAEEIIDRADIIFCLDYNALHRTGKMQDALQKATGKKILIDHHLDPVLEDFDLYHSTIQSSSTAELVYKFIVDCGWSRHLDTDSATGLYVGIMTDTGSFSYSCDLPETYEITASLLRTGINAGQIHRMVYDTYSESRLRLLGYCLSEKLTVLPEYSTAYIALSKEELKRFDHQVGDTEGVVNYALSLENIKIAVLMTERNDRVRLSFRSKGNFSVNQLAREHFAGGGHLNAAGGDSFTNLEDTIRKLREVLEQYKALIERSSP